MAHQAKLWRALAGAGCGAACEGPPEGTATPGDGTAPSAGSVHGASASAAPMRATEAVAVTPELVQQLREIVGEEAPEAYLASLLADAHGDLELACTIHFGANGGVIPPVAAAAAAAAGAHASAASSSSSYAPMASQQGATSRAGEAEDDDDAEELELPPGTVAWVIGKEFRLYTSREALEARLQSLGAAVVTSGGGGRRHSKAEVTLIVVAEGTEAGSVVKGTCPDARIVHESWVVKRAMALRSGRIAAAPPLSPAASKRAGKKRARTAAATTASTPPPRRVARSAALGSGRCPPRRPRDWSAP